MRMRLRSLMAAWRLFVTLGSYTSRCLEMTVTGNPGLAKTYRDASTHSYSTYHSFTCPHTRPITHRLITHHIHTISHSLTHSPTPLSLTHTSTHSHSHPITQSFAHHPLTYPNLHPITYSLFHPLTFHILTISHIHSLTN